VVAGARGRMQCPWGRTAPLRIPRRASPRIRPGRSRALGRCMLARCARPPPRASSPGPRSAGAFFPLFFTRPGREAPAPRVIERCRGRSAHDYPWQCSSEDWFHVPQRLRAAARGACRGPPPPRCPAHPAARARCDRLKQGPWPTILRAMRAFLRPTHVQWPRHRILPTGRIFLDAPLGPLHSAFGRRPSGMKEASESAFGT
jgi:hypothetical protein